jgi:hypothetical protein
MFASQVDIGLLDSKNEIFVMQLLSQQGGIIHLKVPQVMNWWFMQATLWSVHHQSIPLFPALH